MHFLAVLNRDGGWLRTADLEAFTAVLRTSLLRAGHSVEIQVVAGKEIDEALRKAAGDDADVIIAGGGDGTVSSAASRLMDKDKALAILPAGTMNLFARTLGIPLVPEAAVEALATGNIRTVDIATANGRPFVHQFSIGIHARLVKLRSRLQFRSRIGKLWASVRAAFDALASPPVMHASLTLDGTEISATTTGIGISNNLFGEGHLPYADIPDGGKLGIYVASAKTRIEVLWLFINIAAGRWQASESVEIHEAQSVTLRVEPRRRRLLCLIDGELSLLDSEVKIEIRPKALRVLVPND
jgi:diacylglycerol kinase family enzyme